MEPNELTQLLTARAATLAVHRADGSILTSPVWFRATEGWIEVVIAESDPKLTRLRADPRCVFMAFETAPPFRGLRVEAAASLTAEGVRDARLEIASRYLGAEAGRRYVAERTKPGVVVRLPLHAARTWDLRQLLPTDDR